VLDFQTFAADYPLLEEFAPLMVSGVPSGPTATAHFLEGFVEAFVSTFPARQDFCYAASFLVVLLRRGEKQWRLPCLVLTRHLCKLFDYYNVGRASSRVHRRVCECVAWRACAQLAFPVRCSHPLFVLCVLTVASRR
jgi:hypothetical protein